MASAKSTRIAELFGNADYEHELPSATASPVATMHSQIP
jgi:hypothetical protein